MNLMQPSGKPETTMTVKRTLCVHVSGSPANLSLAGPLAGMWKAAPGKETEIFSPSLDRDAGGGDMVNAMRHGEVRKVSIEGYTNTFPFTLGVTMSCVQPSEVTDLGEKFAYTVLPASSSTMPSTVYMRDPAMRQDDVWRANYAKWNKHNLETEGVMDTSNQPFVFVHMSHPAIGILKYNAPMIGCDIEKQTKFDGQYYKITRQVMATCCQALRTQVLRGMDSTDLGMFTLQVHRVNAPAWDHVDTTALQGFVPKSKWTAEQLASEKEHHLREFMTKEYQYIARLHIEFEVPTGGATVATP